MSMEEEEANIIIINNNHDDNESVKLLRTSLVYPASPTPSSLSPLRLSCFDRLLRHALYNQRILFYSLSPQQHFLSLIDSLKTSLSHALVHFYPLAGRLQRGKEKHLEVLCNDAGVEFIETVSLSSSLQQMLAPLKPPLLYKLAPRPESKSLDGFHLPLLMIQVTQLEGGMAIGVSMSHILADGHSFWHFLTSWAQLCRGVTSISPYPIHHRFNTEPIQEEEDNPSGHISLPSPMLQERVVHFSSEAILHLKKEANKRRELVEGDNGKPISSYQALCGYLWKCITNARQLSPESRITFQGAIDCRNRLVPPLSHAYFGNAILAILITTSVGELLQEKEGVSFAAQLLHDSIVGFDDQHVRNMMGKYTKKGVAYDISKMGCNIISVSSSSRFPCYETDFGWGKPEGVRSCLGNKCDGKITLFPGREGGGSVDVEIMIHKDCMPRFLNLLSSSSIPTSYQHDSTTFLCV